MAGIFLDTIKYFVFSSFTLRPTVLLTLNSLDLVYLWLLVSPIITNSQNHLDTPIYYSFTTYFHFSTIPYISLITFSNDKLNRVGDKVHSFVEVKKWLNLFNVVEGITSKVSDISCRKQTLYAVLLLNPFMRLTYFLGMPSISKVQMHSTVCPYQYCHKHIYSQ